MKRRMTAVCVVLLMLASIAVAQTPPQMPKPAPEVKRLQYFVGTWNTAFDMKPGPMGPGGKMTGVERTEMMKGGFYLTSHVDGRGFMGEFKELSVIGYDPEEKVYTLNAFNSFGEHLRAKGTVQGDTWTWTADINMAGKPMKTRFTLKEVSPTSYTGKLEIETDSGWTTAMEGKATKVSGRSPRKK